MQSILDAASEARADSGHVHRPQLQARAQLWIAHRGGARGGHRLGVDIDEHHALEALGELLERKVEGLAGAEHHGEARLLDARRGVEDEGLVAPGVLPPALAVLALRARDAGGGFGEAEQLESVRVDRRVEDPGLAGGFLQGSVLYSDSGLARVPTKRARNRPAS